MFLNVATRRVWVSPSTRHPTTDWMEEQAKAFKAHVDDNDLKVALVTRDRDRSYQSMFDQQLKNAGAQVMTLAYRAPNLNAYIERFIPSIQVESLDHFLIFGEQHFDYLVREFVEHYHQERPHQGLENRLISCQPPPSAKGDIHRRTRLGGLLKHYYRAAA